MDAMIGFTFEANVTSRHITSEANALPPGELMRNTIAFTLSLVLALRNSSANVSEPMVPSCAFPGRISPSATITAISFLEDDDAVKLLLYLLYFTKVILADFPNPN